MSHTSYSDDHVNVGPVSCNWGCKRTTEDDMYPGMYITQLVLLKWLHRPDYILSLTLIGCAKLIR